MTTGKELYKILVYADTQTVFARDWVNLVSKESDILLMTVCSTTGKVFNPEDLPLGAQNLKGQVAKDSTLLRFVKKVRKFALSRDSTWFERLLDQYRLITIGRYAKKLNDKITEYEPDIIHAMRIPYEGIITTHCTTKVPIVLSIWGNDLTLHASQGGQKEKEIRRAIKFAAAIHVDAKRDLDLLFTSFDFSSSKPNLLLPASGGINSQKLRLDISKAQAKIELGYSADTILVCNPRGIRSYINTSLYTEACESLIEKTEGVVFMLVGVDEGWNNWDYSKDASNNNSRLISTGGLNIDRFRLLLRAIDVFVSPSYHDGFPISLLEGLGSGVFPVLSNIDSVKEYVRHRKQGRLFDMDNSKALVGELFDVVSNVNLSESAKENERIMHDEYSIEICTPKILRFYSDILTQR